MTVADRLIASMFDQVLANDDEFLVSGLDEKTARYIQKMVAERPDPEFRSALLGAARLREAQGTRPERRASLFVYFIQRGSTGPIKIGCASDAEARLRSLQTGCPDRLWLLLTLPGGQPQEAEFHRRFAADRLRGEWFAPSSTLIQFIGANT